MMCQRIGRPPISTIGLGRNSVSSRRRVPSPPQRMTTFTGTSTYNAAFPSIIPGICRVGRAQRAPPKMTESYGGGARYARPTLQFFHIPQKHQSNFRVGIGEFFVNYT